jgi:hypothetical protein
MSDDGRSAVSTRLFDEAHASLVKWGPYRSPHEAYGVLAEEMAELLDAMHRNHDDDIRTEALQVAAVAYRLSRDGWKRNAPRA